MTAIPMSAWCAGYNSSGRTSISLWKTNIPMTCTKLTVLLNSGHVASTGWTRYSGQPYSFYPIPIQKPNRKIMMETIIIDRICTSCGCDKETAREYLDAEVRNLRELRNANDLREGDLESAMANQTVIDQLNL